MSAFPIDDDFNGDLAPEELVRRMHVYLMRSSLLINQGSYLSMATRLFYQRLLMIVGQGVAAFKRDDAQHVSMTAQLVRSIVNCYMNDLGIECLEQLDDARFVPRDQYVYEFEREALMAGEREYMWVSNVLRLLDFMEYVVQGGLLRDVMSDMEDPEHPRDVLQSIYDQLYPGQHYWR